jgi:hypothetical protein
VATDPAGTQVTYALTAAPDTATISGNTITWTPTRAQSRVENTFTVTATTAAGGSGTQTWTVTPTGIIYGTFIDKFWTADGSSVNVPRDLTGVYVGALVPQQDGTVTQIHGAGLANGTFTIPNVPAGNYWLVFDNVEYYWTDSSSFDHGSDYIGRPQDPNQVVNTTFAFNLTGLNAPQSCCYLFSLELLSPNANSQYRTQNYVDYGMTVFNYLEGPKTVTPIDPSRGDTTYVLQQDSAQLAGDKGTFIGVTSALALNSFATNPGGATTTPVEGQMGGTPITFDVNVKGSGWASVLTTAGPVAPDTVGPISATLSVLPFVTDKYAAAAYGNDTTLASMSASTSIDEDLGSFQYVNPYSSTWKPVFTAWELATFPITIPGATLPGSYRVGVDFITHDVPTGPIAPLMSTAKNPKINGADFFSSTTTNAPVTITWDQPTGLPTFGYEIGIFTYVNNYATVGYLYTSGTSVDVPSVLLSPGSSYIFTIKAMADSRANIATSPWRSGLPIADAQIVSGVLTVSGTASSASFVAPMQSVKRGTAPNDVRRVHELRLLKPIVKPD